MASIIKRKKSYSVVYNYTTETGETKQKWETVRNYQDALKRKAEIENEQHHGNFIPPSDQTVREFLYDFVVLYGEKKWGVSMYDGCTALIENYINPLIGDLKIQSITTRTTDQFVQELQKTPAVGTAVKPNKDGRMVTDKTIEKIIKLLRCAFGQAVRWELLSKNPFEHTLCPQTTYAKRDIWDADTIMKALNECEDSRLYIAMNLSFACSLRMGEILGLTWDNVHIEEDIANDNAWIYIDKELERVSKRAMEALGEKNIIKVFTPLMPNTSTRVVLKTPKTESSVRKVWLPKTLAYILREWRDAQNELKDYLGDEYQDYNLVVALPNGRPCENRVISKEFEKLKEKAGLPNVVFHSLRHSSTTYKLKLNHGDLKATQGDTGHAQLDMITDIYAHILDEDRKINAQKFETAFYGTRDLRNVRSPQEPAQEPQQNVDLAALIDQLQKNPELAATLASLIAAGSKSSE
ncbi:MAG: site-specific integrase [Clostridia bacterium]|nr:site-specific integrase [Clostridia bacterium]